MCAKGVLIKGFCDGFGVRGCAPNQPISDRIKGFCDGCAPRNKGALRWFRGVGAAPKPTNFGPDKGVLRAVCAPESTVSVLIKGFCDGFVGRGYAPRPINVGPEKALRWHESPFAPAGNLPFPLAGNVKKKGGNTHSPGIGAHVYLILCAEFSVFGVRSPLTNSFLDDLMREPECDQKYAHGFDFVDLGRFRDALGHLERRRE